MVSGLCGLAEVQAQSALAPAAAAARPHERALTLSRRYVDLTQPAEQTAAMIETLAPPADDPAAAEMRSEYLSTMRETQLQMREAVIVGYARLYTEAELEALLTFYGSPAGRSIVAKAPGVSVIVRDAMGRLLDERQARKCAADPTSFRCRRPTKPPPAAPA